MVVLVVRPGVDLPEQSVSSALLPVMMLSNQMRSKNISLLLIRVIQEDQAVSQSGEEEETEANSPSVFYFDILPICSSHQTFVHITLLPNMALIITSA